MVRGLHAEDAKAERPLNMAKKPPYRYQPTSMLPLKCSRWLPALLLLQTAGQCALHLLQESAMSILPAAATRTGKEAHKGAGNMDGSRCASMTEQVLTLCRDFLL